MIFFDRDQEIGFLPVEAKRRIHLTITYIHVNTLKVSYCSAFSGRRGSSWWNRDKESSWQSIGKHHIVVNDIVEAGEEGTIIYVEHSITLHQGKE